MAQAIQLVPAFVSMALAAVDWRGWQRKALEFFRAHPGLAAGGLTRSERLVVAGAKEAYAVVLYKAAAGVRDLGGQPCTHCGEWTGCYCEGCVGTPTAVCTQCDQDRLLCGTCLAAGLLYGDVERHGQEGVMEVTGFHNERGEFVRLTEPLRIPTEDIPTNPDGTFNTEELMAFIQRGERPGRGHRPCSGSSAGRPQ